MSTKKNKHILVVTQYFFPEQFRINDICIEWVKRGYKVTVLTGIPNYPSGKFYPGYGLFRKPKEIYYGVEIIRIPIIPRGKKTLMLVLNYMSFVLSGFCWNLYTRIKADYVFIFEVSPMTQALPGIWYAKRKKIPCYIYVQDLWPDNVQIITGITNKYIIGAIGMMVDYIYSRCNKIFSTSNSFVESINNRGVPLKKIEYWPQYAEDFYRPSKKMNIPEIPDDGSLNIIFTGNIGAAQGLDILPIVAVLLKKREKKVRFNIVGDGRYKEKLIEIVISNNVQDMFNFISKQHPTRIPQLLASCDAALICLTKDPLFAKTIPAKLQSYLACGIPIIASADGEISQIIQASNAGVCSSSGDIESLTNNIERVLDLSELQRQELALNARSYYNRHFNKNDLLDRMDNYFGVKSK